MRVAGAAESGKTDCPATTEDVRHPPGSQRSVREAARQARARIGNWTNILLRPREDVRNWYSWSAVKGLVRRLSPSLVYCLV